MSTKVIASERVCTMRKKEMEKYFKARAREVQRILKDGTPWGFLCVAAFLDCLSKLVAGNDDRKREGYKDFIKKYLKTINPKYASFRYLSGKTDLDEQLYHVLRCGIIHSFSMTPDKQSLNNGGRPYSIVLCHQTEAKTKRLFHLSNYSKGTVKDACILIAEDFGKDLEEVVGFIFSPKARRIDTNITKNMKQWIKQQPPISGGF